MVFRNLTIGYSAPAGDFALKVARSKAVHMTNCTVNMGASFVGSAAVIAGSTFSRKQATFPINSSRAAIDAMSSKLELVGVQATGQTGVFPFLQSRPALAAAASQIRILGDATSIYQAGAFQNSGLSNPALMGTNGSTLEIDPRVVLKPTGTASGHAGFSQVTIRQMSIFTTSGGNLGGSLVIDLRSRPQDPFVVALSLPATPVDLPPLGRAWVDPKTLVPLAFGTQGTTGQWRRVLPVPNTPALRGLPLLLQSLSGSTFVELTNPSLVVIH